jgi:hypothetical protein
MILVASDWQGDFREPSGSLFLPSVIGKSVDHH